MTGNPKYIEFFTQLNTVINSLDPVEVKTIIGDSINNNRTLTVGQVVRFLTSTGSTTFTNLGISLENIFNITKVDIKNNRKNLRTDAIDINEFLNFYQDTVIGGGELRGLIGRNVSLVA